jgi:hypothetical protein
MFVKIFRVKSIWGPLWDHTGCAMLNDLRVRERHTPWLRSRQRQRPGKTRCRYFLGVKWSQVQIVSARQVFLQFRWLIGCSAGSG